MTKPMTREELEKKASELVDDLEFMVELPYSRRTISEALEREVKPLLMEMAKLGIRYGFEKAREEQIPFWESDEDSNYWVLESKYESAEQVIEELDKEQDGNS